MYHLIPSPVGLLEASLRDGYLERLEFLFLPNKDIELSAFAAQVAAEIDKYFRNPQHKISLPIKLSGTPFQQKVWRALQATSPGTIVTYQELATSLNTSPRAIGQACRQNPIPIVIPCHRVVAKNDIGGFAGNRTGHFVEIKERLLRHENRDAKQS